MKEGKVQIYTGNGKGKTTAALGLCFRALGHDMSVFVFQFQKGQTCGEHIEAERIGLPIIKCGCGRGSDPCQSPCPLVTKIKEILADEEPDILVLDEIMAAIRRGCVSTEEALEITELRPHGTEIIMTGRDAPNELIEAADLVTSMEPIKHYFKDGLKAREGIEY